MAQWDSYAALTSRLGALTLLIRDAGQTALADQIRTVTDAQLLEFLIDAAPSLLIPNNGQMLNGKISVSVASNNLTLAIKTASGGDPSSSDKVYVNINGTIRTISSALSVTKNAGTNWCNAGSSELATLEIDYFAYLIWNTGPVTDVIDIGFARIPSGRVYSDFSSTSTNEKYLAYGNATQPAATDDVCVVGRFAATLSAGAGYTWSVPTFTNANLILQPVFETRLLTWVPTQTGFGTPPASGIYQYQINVDGLRWTIRQPNNATSTTTGFTLTAPFAAMTITNGLWQAPATVTDNGAIQTSPGLVYITSGVSTFTATKDYSAVAASWTASGNKRINGASGFYPI